MSRPGIKNGAVLVRVIHTKSNDLLFLLLKNIEAFKYFSLKSAEWEQTIKPHVFDYYPEILFSNFSIMRLKISIKGRPKYLCQ
jgi:hypothetical protein